jgi:hypothetical protein
MSRSAVLLLILLLAGLASLFGDAQSLSSGPVSGVVRDEHEPLAGARVRFQGEAFSTLSDEGGRFRLPASPGARRVTAWKEGYFIAGVRVSHQPILRLTPLPREDHDGYEWVDPRPLPGDEQRCGNCHAHLHKEWSGSAHARSVTGKHFLNLYEGSDWHGRRARGWSLKGEHPDGAGVCSSCHAPTVRDEDPALFDLTKVQGVSARGVHCDYCHKVAGPGEGEIGLTHGRFFHRLVRPRQGQLFFGSLDDVDRGEDAFTPFYRDSRYCAACHEGVVFGVHVYTTYSEWRQSNAARAGRHCQSCHMKPTGQLTNVAPGHGGIHRDPRTLSNHTFWDGSQEQMLRRCLDLRVGFEAGAEGVEVIIRLTARGVGHRVPTGFIDRQVILVVEGFNEATSAALRDGPELPRVVGPELAGKPGRLYARLLTDPTGRGPVPFWRGHTEPEDTRLFPDQPDVRRYRFAPGLDRVRIRVLHRRFWDETIRQKSWPNQDLVVIDRVVGR